MYTHFPSGVVHPVHLYQSNPFQLHYIISILAKVPAVSCRLGRVPYDCASNEWLCSIQLRLWRSHSVFLIHCKKFDFRKISFHRNQSCTFQVCEPDPQPTQHNRHSCNKCNKYHQFCLGCGFAGI